MRTSYVRPLTEVVHDIEIKRSRFIAIISPAADEAQARALIDAARTQYPDARHHCSAFVCHVEGANPIERSSDDGEPAGTAGKPMLDVLKGSGMLDICAVVVRYFGGVKLGAGGLVHAYGGVVSEALELVERGERALRELYRLELTHAEAGKFHSLGWPITDTEYGAHAVLTVAVEPGRAPQLAAAVAELTQGRVEPVAAGQRWVG